MFYENYRGLTNHKLCETLLISKNKRYTIFRVHRQKRNIINRYET